MYVEMALGKEKHILKWFCFMAADWTGAPDLTNDGILD